jgi:hypothetical protein
LSVPLKSKPASFELFANWAKTLFWDFNEIDRCVRFILCFILFREDIETLRNGIEVESKTQLLENYIDF